MSKDQPTTSAPVSTIISQADLAKAFAGTGVDAKDLRNVEGLIPGYVPDWAFSKQWPELVVMSHRIIELPEQKADTDDAWTPMAFQGRLLKANKGRSGNKRDGREVALDAGQLINIFIGGSLRMKEDLVRAFCDRDNVYPIYFKVVGQQPSKHPSDMWVWATYVGKPVPRQAHERLIASDFGPEAVGYIVKGEFPPKPGVGNGFAGQLPAPQATA